MTSRIFILSLLFSSTHAWATHCTYHTWEWHAEKRISVNHRRVTKKKNELLQDEQDPRSNCTVCQEDQVRIELAGAPPVEVCRHFEQKFRKALKTILQSGYKIEKMIGYRVGKSRGAIDKNGLRSLFSNHSFGTAIDINAHHNGLYKKCKTFGPHCLLSRGGAWDPNHPLAITKESVVYQAFRQINFKWGGSLPDEQKDYMHFSLNGY